MKKNVHISITTVGLAIFSMFFGAGNIIYPIYAGFTAGSQNYLTIWGFLITGVLLPLVGLIAMILFDGNYKNFFARAGKFPSFLSILFCMLILGPLLVMPRCVTLPYEMVEPFLPNISLPIFSIIFCTITFILTYKESKLLDVLGKFISPLLLGSTGCIIILGLLQAQTTIPQTLSTSYIFFDQVVQGFKTLDLIGSLFFAYIVLRILRTNDPEKKLDHKHLALSCLKAGGIAASCLAIIYIGFSFLGAYYAHLLNPSMNGAEMFRIISLHVVGKKGIIVLIVAAFMACFSTISALAAIFAEYVSVEVFQKKVSYIHALALCLITTAIISNFGLTTLLRVTDPFINFGYPILVTIVLCNLAYSLFGFRWIKLPMLISTLIMIGMYIYSYFA